jgi:hypothetical protein
MKGMHRKGISQAAALLLLFAAACGGGTATISGTVTYKGEPLTAGYVAFYDTNGQTASGRIEADGHYTVYKAPVGELKAAVFTVDLTAKPPVGFTKKKQPGGVYEEAMAKSKRGSANAMTEAAQAGKFIAIPARYKDPEQSGLTFTVKSGSQTIDLDLKP